MLKPSKQGCGIKLKNIERPDNNVENIRTAPFLNKGAVVVMERMDNVNVLMELGEL